MAKSDYSKTDIFNVPPEEIVIITDPQHPLYDERVTLPLVEATVLDIMKRGVLLAVICRRNREGKFEVMDGRQRVRHAVEANRRIVASGGVPITIPVKPSRADDNRVFDNLVALNRHRTNDGPTAIMRNLVRYIEMGHSEEDAQVTFNFANKQTVKNYLVLADGHPDVHAAIDAKQLSVGAALKLVREVPYEDQPKMLGQNAGAESNEHADVSNVRTIERAGQVSVESVRRLAEGSVDTDSDDDDAKPKRKNKSSGAPRHKKLTTKEIAKRAAEAKGEVAAVPPGKRALGRVIDRLNGFIDDERVDQTVLRALKYGIEFALIGEAAERSDEVQELLTAMKAAEDGTVPEAGSVDAVM